MYSEKYRQSTDDGQVTAESKLLTNQEYTASSANNNNNNTGVSHPSNNDSTEDNRNNSNINNNNNDFMRSIEEGDKCSLSVGLVKQVDSDDTVSCLITFCSVFFGY
ncbi:unnamed protein product [Trichobilharzia regenti]|nr:unnamed protein product [Trichobilharzia regenti]